MDEFESMKQLSAAVIARAYKDLVGAYTIIKHTDGELLEKNFKKVYKKWAAEIRSGELTEKTQKKYWKYNYELTKYRDAVASMRECEEFFTSPKRSLYCDFLGMDGRIFLRKAREVARWEIEDSIK